ncbi:MAG: hypothetical protein AAB664_02755, partial [Patescibacteria group bacterium]
MSRMMHFIFLSRCLNLLPEEYLPSEIGVFGLPDDFLQAFLKKRFKKASVTFCENIPNGKTFDVLFVNGPYDPLVLKSVLACDGYLLFLHPTHDSFDPIFSLFGTTSFFHRRCFFFRHFGQGQIGDPMPEGYQDRQQSKINLETSVRAS